VGADFVGDPAAAGQLEATWWEPTLSAIPRQRARLRQAPIADEVGSHQGLPPGPPEAARAPIAGSAPRVPTTDAIWSRPPIGDRLASTEHTSPDVRNVRTIWHGMPKPRRESWKTRTDSYRPG
jgi:hypothetical protein